MPKTTIFSLVLLFCLTAGCVVVASAQDCKPPAITANSQNYNIFSPEQEMILGDLNYQRMAGETRYLQDEKLLAYVREIGERLVRHMPPTGLKFQFFIIDIPTANAFNTPGGYVFLSRKLIAFTKTEDELAGVMAHELGHATVRHSASDISELFKKILNVTQLGDRKDITDKFNLLIERERTKSVSRGSGHESAQQLEADRIGLFAMVAAGYDPNAFSEFFARLTEAKAKSGNWFTSIFGGTSPTEKRLREMVKATELLPAPCRDSRAANASQQYLKWQADVVSFRQPEIAEELPGLLWKRELSPQLKSDIWHLAFSSDGKYFLAQDDFAITLVQRDPLKVAFQIPTTDARPAAFTPDGQFVMFGTESLRFEKWSIAEAKPVEARELVVRRDCWEQEFSPDGKYLACVDFDLGLSVLETQTGKRIFQKKQFATLSALEFLMWIVGRIADGDDDDSHGNTLFNLQFSPDSRYLVATRSAKYRVTFMIDSRAIDAGNDNLVALDLSTQKPTSLTGDLKKATRRSFIFLSPDKILATMPVNVEDAGIFTFPQGARIAKFALTASDMKLTANPNYVMVKSYGDNMVSFFDLSRGELTGGFNKTNVALWNNVLISEVALGTVSMYTATFNAEAKTLRSTPAGSIELPVGSMNRIYAANVSDNMQWLAVSSKTRGAVWDLNSGERKLHVRGFRGAIVAANGSAIGDFPKLDPVNHSLVYLDAVKKEINVLREIPERGARQHGRFVLFRTSLKELKDKPKERSKDGWMTPSGEEPLTRDVRFELRDIVSDKVIWTKDFPKEAPGYFFDDFSGRVIFYWNLGSEAGKARLKEDAALVERSRQMGNKDDDYVLEIFDAFQNTSVGTLLLETGKGSFDIKSGFSEGDWLVLRDDNNRVLTYSIKDGDLRHRFFGANAAMSPGRNHLIVENYPGELTVYDLATGNAQARLRFKTSAAFVRFSLDGKRLMVLTSGQVAYAFDVDKLIAGK